MSSLGADERFNLSHKSQILFFLLELWQYPAVLLRTSVSSLHTEYHGDNHYLSPQVPIRVRACRPHHELGTTGQSCLIPSQDAASAAYQDPRICETLLPNLPQVW